VRVVATQHDPSSAKVGDYCSDQLATLSPDETIDNAVQLMRKKAIRRIPVVEGDRAVGIVALGDLAVDRDPKSALGGISGAQPNL
jgi:CBS domain-containing protein